MQKLSKFVNLFKFLQNSLKHQDFVTNINRTNCKSRHLYTFDTVAT